ncbi:alpha/beta hydrolase [Labilibaculum euxinus]
MKQKIFILNCLLIISFSTYSQNLNQSIQIDKYETENGEKFTIHSHILNQDKEIFIGLPKNFNDSTNYPMILVLEGEVVFETFAPVTRLMAEVNEIPECIVVGIPFYNKHLEYAPKISQHPESGNADKMLEFYSVELFPLLDSLYNCGKDRILWSHSALGGIFCTYALLGPDGQFNGILSSSPSLKWMPDYVDKENAFEELAKKDKVFYYLTFGSDEGDNYMGDMYDKVKKFKQRLEKEAPSNLIWKYQLNENNNHLTNALETYSDGLILYFKEMNNYKR